MLKPHVDILRNSHPAGQWWRGDIGCGSSPFTARQWSLWFASYKAFILKYAALAQEERVAMLSINCELYCANRQAEQWRSVVASVRAVFHGWLTEAAMPQGCAGSAQNSNGSTIGGSGQCAGITSGMLTAPCVDGVDWWSSLDFIGIDAYFVLNATTLDALVRQWRPYVNWARGLSELHGKQVVFTEIGYCSGLCSRDHQASVGDYQQQDLHYQVCGRGGADTT